MSDDVMLKEAIQAIHQGQRGRARDLFARLLRADQTNPSYWLWMSSLVDTLKEQVYCLQTVLKLDPGNTAAKKGLIILGAIPADPVVEPVPPPSRRWETPLLLIPKARLMDNPIFRLLLWSLLGIVIVAALVFGGFTINARRISSRAFIPTRTPGPSPTYTSTPTVSNYTQLVPTSTPRMTDVPPLWTLLKATYTPTALYVSTPHPINEAYRVGQVALARNNLDIALQNLQQALLIEPSSADILVAIAEVQRLKGDHIKALSSFENALEIDPEFAPAYLGRARLLRQLDSKADVQDDLEKAIELDPGFGEALLELADYLLEKGEIEPALEYLKAAEDVLPGSPLVHLYRAQVYLLQGENEQALEEARTSNQLDLTLLTSYRTLGQAAALSGEYEEAFKALDTYLIYEKNDASAWVTYGEALYATSQYSQTIQALNTALALDPELDDAFFTKGLAYIELGEGQKAINEIFRAIRLKPNTFQYQLNLARALYVAGRLEEAVGTMFSVERLAENDQQLVQVYYWRAVMLEAQGESYLALKDWRKLLKLEEEIIPLEWLAAAREHTADTPTPAPTATPILSLTPRPVQTKTVTPRPTATPTSG